MQKNILFLDTCNPSFIKKLNALSFICHEDYNGNRLEILAKINNYEGLVIRSRISIDKDFLLHAHNLKFIARVGAGMENIDVNFANTKNITCLHAPEGNSVAVGEHALAMLLMLFTKLNIVNNQMRNNIWQREQNRGIELTGKTIGIIGFGNMGMAFAKCLQGFNCTILVYDKYKKIEEYPNIKQVDLNYLQKNADVISLHVPYNKETHHYIDSTFLSVCKHGVYVINTARGKCLNTIDLINALDTKKIAGACLDVFEYESSSFENINTSANEPIAYLIKSDAVILSPHIAGWTHESNIKMTDVLVKKINALYNLI